MIAITGATGHLGKATLNFLVTQTNSADLIAIGRDAQKLAEFADKGVTVRQADYGDYNALVTALADVDTLLLVSSSALGEERVQQHANVIRAAKEAGVKRIVYTSATNPGPSAAFAPAIDHFKTEKLLAESGLTYTIARNNFYLDILPMLLGNPAESGRIYLPAGEGKTSFALRDDMAQALAVLLTTPGHDNAVYDLGADTAWSFADVAAALTDATGKPVEYVTISGSDYTAELARHVPPPVVEMLAGLVEGIRQNDFNQPSPTLTQLLGRSPMTLPAYLARQN